MGRRIFWALATALAVTGAPTRPAIADAATHRAAAERYLEVTQVPARLDSFMVRVREKQLAAVGKWYVPTDTREPAKVYVGKASKLFTDELSWSRLKDEFIRAYVSVYTEQDLLGLVEFYESPLGQKYLAKRPQLVSNGLEITERHLKTLLPKLEMLSEELAHILEKAKAATSDR